MTDELVERLLDWPYQGETMAHEAADRIKQLTAERDEARRDAVEAEAYATELEAERDHAWDMVAKANAQIGQSLADRLQDKEEITRLQAQVRFLERKVVT